MALVRFVVLTKDEDSQKRQGLFQAIADLDDSGMLHAHEQVTRDEIKKWFSSNLERPSKFARSSKPYAKNVAISWFKDTATEHIQMMHRLTHVLRAHGVHVEIIKTDRPGYVVYQDEYQVTAVPFGDSGA
jgi:hypothetical protein